MSQRSAIGLRVGSRWYARYQRRLARVDAWRGYVARRHRARARNLAVGVLALFVSVCALPARASDLPPQCDRPELTDLLFYECLVTVAEAERDLARADVTYLRAVLDASTDHALAVEQEPRGWPTWALGVAVVVGLVGGLLVAR